MNLVIDIGNSLSKTAFFEDSEILRMDRSAGITTQQADEWLKEFPVTKCILSTVSADNQSLVEHLEKRIPCFIQHSHRLAFPFRILYRTPETLGIDRIAAVAGAYNLFRGKNVMVIDMGTAITYEILTATGEYAGGNISPGLVSRFRALNAYTARLPLLEPRESKLMLGEDTPGAIRAGVQQGIIFELLGYIDYFSSQYPDLQIALTGGDLDFFADKLKRPIFVLPNLVLVGLNFILEYNASQNCS